LRGSRSEGDISYCTAKEDPELRIAMMIGEGAGEFPHLGDIIARAQLIEKTWIPTRRFLVVRLSSQPPKLLA